MRPENLVVFFSTQGDFNESELLATKSQENKEETTKGIHIVHVTKNIMKSPSLKIKKQDQLGGEHIMQHTDNAP